MCSNFTDLLIFETENWSGIGDVDDCVFIDNATKYTFKGVLFDICLKNKDLFEKYITTHTSSVDLVYDLMNVLENEREKIGYDVVLLAFAKYVKFRDGKLLFAGYSHYDEYTKKASKSTMRLCRQIRQTKGRNSFLSFCMGSLIILLAGYLLFHFVRLLEKK